MQKVLVIILFFLGVVHTGFGQNESIDSLRADFDKSYGLDVLLNNGRKYIPDNNQIIGHPFWKSDDSFTGNLNVKGRTFNDLKLKFNLYKQEFILIYSNLNGQSGQIILNSEAIDSVRTGTVLFVPNKNPEIKQKFVQQIHSGKLECFMGRYKELEFNRTGVNIGSIYTSERHSYYLIYNGEVHQFARKSSFLRIFDGIQRSSIRKYMSSNHFRIKNMNENELRKLIIYSEKTLN